MSQAPAIPLDSPRWEELTQTYGHGGPVPDVLRRLASATRTEDEPWDELWGMLCHDGDPGTAAFAAVPHLFAIARTHAGDADRLHPQWFSLPAAIEASRLNADGDTPPMPDDVADAYQDAWRAAPALVAATFAVTWDTDLALAIVAVLAFAKDQQTLGTLAAALSVDELDALVGELREGAFDEEE